MIIQIFRVDEGHMGQFESVFEKCPGNICSRNALEIP